MRYVAFLRAVNVAGHARVPTQSLVAAFETVGFMRVESLYASGNIMFDCAPRLLAGRMRRVRHALRRVLGEEPHVFVRTPAQLGRLLARPPFSTRQRASRDKLWVAFLGPGRTARVRTSVEIPHERLTLIEVRGREAFAVSRQKPTGFWCIPNPLLERMLGVPSTCRQWSTVVTVATRLSVPLAR